MPLKVSLKMPLVMQLRNLRRIEMITCVFLIFGLIFGFVLGGGATPARAEVVKTTCVFKDLGLNETCPVFATGRALEVMSLGDEAIIFVDSESRPSSPASKAPLVRDRTSIVTSSRIEDAVLLDQMDEDDGLLVEREVLELSGARYELPASRREVKKQLGFPESAEIAGEDWIDMIRVHAEMALSISASASRFLLEQVGLVAGRPRESEPAADSDVSVSGAASVETAPSNLSNPTVIETH